MPSGEAVNATFTSKVLGLTRPEFEHTDLLIQKPDTLPLHYLVDALLGTRLLGTGVDMNVILLRVYKIRDYKHTVQRSKASKIFLW